MNRPTARDPADARKMINKMMQEVFDELNKQNLRMSPRMKKKVNQNFYMHLMFGEELIPLKNIINDVKNNTNTSAESSKYSSLEQTKNIGYFDVNWEKTRESVENINYDEFETFNDFKAQPYNMEHTLCVCTFNDFKKVFSVITDEDQLKKIFEEQKTQDRKLKYKSLNNE